MAELVLKENSEIISKVETVENLEEELVPPVSVPSLTEEAVDDFKEELKKIDNEKRKKKDALRARVKAAQERARKARQKQAQEEAERQRKEQEKEKERLLKRRAAKSKSPIVENIEPPPFEILSPPLTAPPIPEQQILKSAPPPPPPILQDTLKQAILNNNYQSETYLVEEKTPPPPPYDMFDQLTVKAPPPQLDNTQSFLRQTDLPLAPPPLMMMEPPQTTMEFENMPSAPPVVPLQAPLYQEPMQTHMSTGNLPPPSFIDYEQNEIAEAVNNEETTERLVKEQEKILEQLEQEKAANDAAIAEAATSGLFEADSYVETSNNTTMTSSVPVVKTSTTSSRTSNSATQHRNGNTINIGPNTKVTLRGEEQTKAAIDAGTAMIVQCMACRNWMQVANTATLMFCPSCSTISRVEPQHQVTSLDEAKLLMAHKRKKEKREEKERKLKEYRDMSWGQYVKSFFVSIEPGETTSSAATPTATDNYRNSTSRSSSQQFETARGFSREDYEDYYEGEEAATRQSLVPVSTFETEQQPPPARIAEKRPLHSCLTGLTKTLTGGSGYPGTRGNDEIDGIDATALLSVTRVGRRTH